MLALMRACSTIRWVHESWASGADRLVSFTIKLRSRVALAKQVRFHDGSTNSADTSGQPLETCVGDLSADDNGLLADRSRGAI